MRPRVIVETDMETGKTAGFWDGARWVAEYPDARRYPTTNRAIEAVVKIKARNPGHMVEVVGNYGMADQEIEWKT